MSLAATASPTRRHLLELADLEPWEFEALLDLAATMERHPGAWRHSLEGRAVACVFHAPSLAAHLALAVAIHRLGAFPVLLTPDAAPDDDARVLSRSCDAIVVHGAAQRHVRDVAERSAVPVINARSREHDPWTALAVCTSLRERFGGLDGLCVAHRGPPDGLTHSLLQAAPLAPFALHLAHPYGAMADPGLIARAGRCVRVFDDSRAAAREAHAVVGEDELSAYRVSAAQALLYALITGDWEAPPC